MRWFRVFLMLMWMNTCCGFHGRSSAKVHRCHRIPFGQHDVSGLVFSYISQHHRPKIVSVLRSTYGRGVEIWPECNEDAVQLSRSFPSGKIPTVASEVLQETEKLAEEDEITDNNDNFTGRKRIPEKIYKLLRRAAGSQEEEAFQGSSEKARTLDLSPAVIGVLLLVGGLVQPVDVLWATFLSSYAVVLGKCAKSRRRDGTSPTMPSLPPQEHVPALVSNPLGITFTRSRYYRVWLKLGTLIGLFGPLAVILRYVVVGGHDKQMGATTAGARPLFLLCCQAFSEATSRRVMAPLPLRILIPVAYNTVRLGPLFSWALSPEPLGYVGRTVAVANLLYWTMNLFIFLLPIATVRYMRAHFFCVEAEQVTTRSGFEDSMGLLP